MKITDEMVEKAATELLDWDEPKTRRDAQQMARAVIAKIAPLIRSAALEEAARVADEIDRTYENHDLRWGVQRCAERIRALKDKPHE